MTTAQKLWLGFGSLMGILVLVVIVELIWVYSLSEHVDELADVAGPVTQTTHRLEVIANMISAEVLDYLYVANESERATITDLLAAFEAALDDYRDLTSLESERDLAEEAELAFQRYRSLCLLLLNEKDAGNVPVDALTTFLQMRVQLDATLVRAQSLADTRIQASRRKLLHSTRRLQWASIFLVIAGSSVAVLAAIAISRGILSTEEELQASNARKAAILNNALDGIVTIDGSGRVVEFNPAAERIFGYRSEDIAGKEMALLIVPESLRELHRAGLERQRRSEQSKILGQRLELTALRASGEEFPVEVSIVRIGSSRAPMFTGFIRDIAERKRAEAALGERMQLLQLGTDIGTALTQGTNIHEVLHGCTDAIVANLDAAFARIWLVDKAGQTLELRASSGMYTHLNGAHARIPMGEFKIGRIAQQQQPHLTNQVIGDPQIPDQQWARHEGMVAFAGFPLVVDRRAVGVLGMFAKKTLSPAILEGMESICKEIAIGIRHELAQAELLRSYEQLEERVEERTADLRETNQALVRSNYELEQFASVASHDLQEPLRKIQAFGERLHTKYSERLDDQGQQYIARMQSAATRMRTLIDDLLSFSRVTTKARPFESIDMNLIVDEVLYDIEARIEDSGGRVEVSGRLSIEADPMQMRQLMQNLISNGLKFRRENVRPLVRVEMSPDPNDQEFCVIRVADNGIGFDETYLDRIFEVFQRLHGRLEYEGTGMGLAICRKIVERHGGSITASSQAGAGAVFLVRLPLKHAGTPFSITTAE